jgi:chaperone modulatory protein CbpM
MSANNLTAATDFCSYHHIETTFITSLEEAGLIEITIIDQTRFIPESQLSRLERMVRLHHDLDINIPGIEAVVHLLERVETMQQEMQSLRNRLRIYE